MEKDQGFVLRKTKYSESSTILQIFTRKEGAMSFYFPGGQKKYQALLSPLAEISFQYRKKSEEQLPMLTKPEEENLWKSIYFDPVKSCQMYFINEVLYRAIPEKDPDADLYAFIEKSLEAFAQGQKTANFHLFFLCKLTYYLGFQPETEAAPKFFDLYNGAFTAFSPKSSLYETGKAAELLHHFFISTLEEQQEIELSGKQRIQLAEILINYYQSHLEGFYPPKSLEVLATVFS